MTLRFPAQSGKLCVILRDPRVWEMFLKTVAVVVRNVGLKIH